MYFTSGVKSLDSAWMRYYSSVINKVGSVKIGVDPSNNQWYYNVTGVQDSHFSASNHWYVRVRLFANNNNRIYYTSYVYNSANYVADTKPNHFNSHQNYPLTY